MAHTTTIQSLASRPQGSFVGRLVHDLRAWADARRAEQALLRMDDRQLADIGVTRGDIAEAVRHGRH